MTSTILTIVIGIALIYSRYQVTVLREENELLTAKCRMLIRLLK